MSYNIGDKFIIEIGGVFNAHASCKEEWDVDHNGKLYRIKGFRALVFDDNGLDKLEPLDEDIGKFPKSKWVFHREAPMDTSQECPNCHELFGFSIGRYGFCPACGVYNGKRAL